MEPVVDCVIEDPRWDAFGLAPLAQGAAVATLRHLGLAQDGFTLCLMGCDDTRIAALNADFRGKPQPTNVLSWPSEDRAPAAAGQAPDLPEAGTANEPAELGDIAIAYETCMREAAESDTSVHHHVTHLVVHAILHLMGYDHIDDADAAVMEQVEVEILATLGIADPYRAGT